MLDPRKGTHAGTGLTDEQLGVIEQLLSLAKRGGRPRTVDLQQAAFHFRYPGLLLVVLLTAANCDDGTHAPHVLAKHTEAHTSRQEEIRGDTKYNNRALDCYLATSAASYKLTVADRPGSQGWPSCRIAGWWSEQMPGSESIAATARATNEPPHPQKQGSTSA